ncbi:tRNA_anti-like [Clostridium cavendishii DSM 21758]|uniref:tRNA_anti-like n=1 Tax=Clostridium cavendishii DSM 21758 TaxID=1121302 RepID=A0A1M6IW81_9CLOT|nr:hypothetical protein [Clostridium cavendishii]SHJ38701.1 tRNA_anti-like [Clostridium cavendishii DSM 21758]
MSNMKNCKTCNAEIAKGVNKCVHCGKDQRNFFMRHKIVTGLIFVVIIGSVSIAVGGKKDIKEDKVANTSATKQAEPDIKINSSDLAKAYDENEVKADKDYKGKSASITGNVEDISVVLGITHVRLSSYKDLAITHVNCSFEDKAEVDKVSGLKKGDTITIEGKIDGKSIDVDIKKCIIKK